MAEAALFSIAQTVLKQLGSKVLQEAALLWGMGDDIKKLTRTLSSIQVVLLDAEEKSHSPQSHQLRLWLKELRQAVYDIEDLLDDFSTEVLRRQGMATASEQISKEVQSFFSSSNQVAYGLKIVHGIQAIRATLDEIAERREMFHLEVLPVDPMATKQREHTHSNAPEMVVGREDDKNNVVKLLLQSNSKDSVSVVPVVGIGGLGKTTLAQLVYNDAAVQSHFELKIWVCISDKFDVKLIVEKMIESCTKRKPEKDLEMDTLVERLHDNVNGRRYLIVLDDVWNEDREKWSRLKGLLKAGAEGSRVLITTRLLKVAKLVAARVDPYQLKGLDEIESWSLFREIAFEGGDVKSRKHESIGREIVAKCKGVPLAIKTVASALFYMERESEWVAFRSKGLWSMDENENDLMATLKLSYDHLPTHLKHCFAYCSLFPKDHEIKVKRLIHLWIAQGFVQSPDPSNRFDIGLEYFNNLLWRSFFQETKKEEQGDITSCKMHDLMHDLAITIAGEESATLAVSNAKDLQSYDSRLTVTRHVSLDLLACDSLEEVRTVFSSIVSNADANKLRTLLGMYRSPGWYDLEPIIFSNTTSLRVLDLSHFWMSMVSHTINKLKHLKYFDLSGNNMKELPEEITELVNLEVLKLDYCRRLEQLPKGTGKLSRIYHLGVLGCDSLTCLPLGIGLLCYLREFPWFRIPGSDIESSAAAAGIGQLRYLNNLRGSLSIEHLERVKNPCEGEEANLKDKQHLEDLWLKWEGREEGDVDAAEGELLEALCPHPNLKSLTVWCNAGLNCPSWLPSVLSLVEITIEGCPNWKRFPSLDQLPFLEKLQLAFMDSLEYIECGVSSSSSFGSFFPSLKLLHLRGCPRLKGWLASGELALPQFPCVSKLVIANCCEFEITSIPYFSLELQSLELLGGSKELLKQILRMPPSSPPLPPFSRSSCLEDMTISFVPDLDTLPREILPRLSASSALGILSITCCPKLRTLSPALPSHLTSLKELSIVSCDELDLCDHDDDYEDTVADELMVQQQLHSGVLPNLSGFSVMLVPKLSRLPEWLQLAPSLVTIYVYGCPMKCIPEWVSKLAGLRDLTIGSFGKSVKQCVDEDWAKIAFIPNISINGVLVQEDGCPQPLNEEQMQQDNPAATDDNVEEEEKEEEAEVTEGEGGEEDDDEEETSKFVQLFMKCSIFGRCFQV